MRTALRTSIVTAALAGALLAPAATAIAAPSAQAVTAVTSASALSANTSASTSANASPDDRYDGETVLVAKGRIAVLRNGAEGPEVWIRAVSPDWKPGDGWAGRVLAKLDPTHKRAVIEGIEYDLRKVEVGQDQNRYGLNVHVLGEGASNGWYLLPKATPATKPAPEPTAKPAAKPSVKPAEQPAAKPAAVPAAKPQTAVVPKGPVAAGAESTEAVADTDDTTTAATGAALIAILAGLGTTFAVRARKARARG